MEQYSGRGNPHMEPNSGRGNPHMEPYSGRGHPRMEPIAGRGHPHKGPHVQGTEAVGSVYCSVTFLRTVCLKISSTYFYRK
jgi:hypothetical protein